MLYTFVPWNNNPCFVCKPMWINEQLLIALWIMFYQDDVFINTDDGVKCCKLIAVHAGLEKGVDVNEQMKILKARDTRIPKIQALSGRKNVWDIPEVIACFLFHVTATYFHVMINQ